MKNVHYILLQFLKKGSGFAHGWTQPDVSVRGLFVVLYLLGQRCGVFGVCSCWLYSWRAVFPLCWSQTGDPSNIRRSLSGNMKSSGKRALSTWVCSWIEGLALANTCRSRLPKPSNVGPP